MRLVGLKEIAVYIEGKTGLSVSIRTVERYRAERGMPVEEHWNGRVFADSDAIDGWLFRLSRLQ